MAWIFWNTNADIAALSLSSFASEQPTFAIHVTTISKDSQTFQK